MATIAETRKLVDQYKKQLQTAMTKVRDQEADVKDILKKQEQAEKDAKAEKKDANKKAGLEKTAQELEKKEKAATTFLGELKKAVALNEATVKKFEMQLEKLEEGVEEFGKSRAGFFEWFCNTAEPQINKLATTLKTNAATAEKEVDAAESAIDKGNVTEAQESVELAANCIGMAEKKLEQMVQLITNWNGIYDSQRNIKTTEFGIEPADTRVHDAITKEVYACIARSDAAKRDGKVHIDRAATRVVEAQKMVKAGGKSAALYESILENAKKALAKIVEEYDVGLALWIQTIDGGGERYEKEKGLIKPGDDVTLNKALKVVEQSRSALPKVLESSRVRLKHANDLVTRETKKVPPEFENAVKHALGALRGAMMQFVVKHKKLEANYAATIQKLDGLEKATHAALEAAGKV